MNLDIFYRILDLPQDKITNNFVEKIFKDRKIKSEIQKLIGEYSLNLLSISFPGEEDNTLILPLDDRFLPEKSPIVAEHSKKHVTFNTDNDNVFLALKTPKNQSKIKIETNIAEKTFTLYRMQKTQYNYLISIFTDFNMYRRGQSIQFRGIVWKFDNGQYIPSANEKMTVMLNDEDNTYAMCDTKSNSFGVFYGSLPTDRYIMPKNYELQFNFADIAYSTSKIIKIADYKKPVIEIIPDEKVKQDMVQKGRLINITGEAAYYYGGKISGGKSLIQLLDKYKNIVVEEDVKTDSSGRFHCEFATSQLLPGRYTVKISVVDTVGRYIDTSYPVRVVSTGEDEGSDEISSIWDFQFMTQGKAVEMSFNFDTNLSSWINRPIYFLWSEQNTVLTHGYFYPSKNNLEILPIPPHSTTFVFLEIFRIERTGKIRRKRVKILDQDNKIQISINGPEQARPGEEIDLDIRINSKRHQNIPKSLGYFLIDSASKAIAGNTKGNNFESMFESTDEPWKFYKSWFEAKKNLNREFDRVLLSILKSIDKSSLGDYYYFLSCLVQPQVLDLSMLEHHIQNFYKVVATVDLDQFLTILGQIVKYNLFDTLDIDKITSFLVQNKLIQNCKLLLSKIKVEVSGSEILLNLFMKDLAISMLNVILYKLTDIQDIRPEIFQVSEVENPLIRSIMNGEILLNEQAIDKLKDIGLTFLDELSKLPVFKVVDQDIVILYLDEDMEMQIGNVFSKEPQIRVPAIVGYPKYQSIMTDVDHYVREGSSIPELQTGSRKSPSNTVRAYFPDISYWTPHIQLDDKQLAVKLKMPDTITEQEFNIFASSLSSDFGGSAKKIKVLQEFFIQADIPPVLSYKDLVEVSLVVTNRSASDQSVTVEIEAEQIAIYGEEKVKLELASGTMKAASWNIQPLATGNHTISFKASSADYSDTVIHAMRVDPIGIPQVKTQQGSLSTSNRFSFICQQGEIAHHLDLAIMPDSVSTALGGLEYLLRYPHGCVEQTTSTTLPNVLVYMYLKSINKLNNALKEDIKERVSNGYARLMSHRNNEQAWGWWQNDRTYTFMTAYVLQTLLLMRKNGFFVRKSIVVQAISRLGYYQNKDGGWDSSSVLYHDKIAGGSSFTPLLTTLYVLNAIIPQDDRPENYQSIVDDGYQYILNHFSSTEKDPHILTYYWSINDYRNTKEEMNQEIINMLLNLQINDHWESNTALGGDVEVTAKVMLILIRAGAEMYAPILKEGIQWIIDQRRSNSGWGSTISTNYAIQAILAYQLKTSYTHKFNVSVNSDQNIETFSFDVNRNNFITEYVKLANIHLTDYLKTGENIVDINYEGKATPVYLFNEKIWNERITSPAGVFTVTRTYSSNNCSIGEPVTVKLTVIPQSDFLEFVVVKETIPPGFTIIKNSLKDQLEYNPQLRSYLLQSDHLLLYPKNAESFTFTYTMIGQSPFHGVHSKTEVNAMYEEDKQATGEDAYLTVDIPEIISFCELLENETVLTTDLADATGISENKILNIINKTKALTLEDDQVTKTLDDELMLIDLRKIFNSLQEVDK